MALASTVMTVVVVVVEACIRFTCTVKSQPRSSVGPLAVLLFEMHMYLVLPLEVQHTLERVSLCKWPAIRLWRPHLAWCIIIEGLSWILLGAVLN